MAEFLDQQPDPACEESSQFDMEYRREVFRFAAEHVRGQVKENTWQAFWMTTIGASSTEDTAKQLGMTVGAVHIARSRVRSRLREIVERMEANGREGDPGKPNRGLRRGQ
jgi:RNA polymerase sigma-70 factor (ECF subfamily)